MTRFYGSDPECFAINKAGFCVPPAILRREGLPTFGFHEEERHPIFYKDPSKEFLVMEDGAAFEFNFVPVTSPEKMHELFNKGVEKLREILLPLGLEVHTKASIPFDNRMLLVNGEVDKELAWACRFGCDKDIDIYSGEFSKDIDASEVLHRFAGGHFHMSPVEQEYGVYLAKLCDIYMGNSYIFSTTSPKEEAERQKYYGRPGKIRLPVYGGKVPGLEYRTPSVSWLNNLDSIRRMFKANDLAMETFDNPSKTIHMIETYLEQTLHNIVNFDRVGAEEVLVKIGVI